MVLTISKYRSLNRVRDFSKGVLGKAILYSPGEQKITFLYHNIFHRFALPGRASDPLANGRPLDMFDPEIKVGQWEPLTRSRQTFKGKKKENRECTVTTVMRSTCKKHPISR